MTTMQYQINNQDCLVHLRSMADNSVDSIVTDPPYGLSFMGKKWDYDVPSTEIWAECLRVLKPGGHLLAFAGTRTQHRMAVRIEDAGFEIRDMIAWVYGSGFPKSLDVSKAIDKAAGAEREVIGLRTDGNKGGGSKTYDDDAYVWDKPFAVTAPATEAAQQWQGWGTALKPLVGTVAENVLEHGTGALNIDGCRVGLDGGTAKGSKPQGDGKGIYGAGLHGACEITQLDAGRWPANLIHDGSDEVVAGFPQTVGAVGMTKHASGTNSVYGDYARTEKSLGGAGVPDKGSAARFFYCAKASKKDRGEGLEGFEVKPAPASSGNRLERMGSKSGPRANTHPTVKPTDLMRYLCRLVTPPNGVVLDPFMGSGSTGKAAMLEGFQFIGIERDAEYIKIAEARIQAAMPKPLQDGLNGTTAADIQQLSLL